MRSRDGNQNFSLRLCSIILICLSALGADEYFISYRYVVKDAIIYNESIQISHAMTRCNGHTYKPLILESKGDESLQSIIDKNKEDFIEYVHKLGLEVNYSSKTSNMQNTSTTILTLKTKCFKVDFNDNFVKIAPLK